MMSSSPELVQFHAGVLELPSASPVQKKHSITIIRDGEDPVASEAILDQVIVDSSQVFGVRFEAVKAVREIGSPASVPSLEQFATEFPHNESFAKQTIATLLSRPIIAHSPESPAASV